MPKKLVIICLLLAFAAACTAGLAVAARGEVDRSFGAGGKVLTPFEHSTGPQVSIAIGSGGRIVAAGGVEGMGIGLARYLADGRLDRSFSADGRMTLKLGTPGIGASDVAIDRRGRIVIGGTVTEPLDPGAQPPKGTYWFAVARLNRNGTPDRSFSGDGLQVMRIGTAAELNAIAIDDRGRIVAAGSSATESGNYEIGYAVARLLPGGGPDPSFSGDGVFTGRFGRLPDGAANDVEIDREGRVVVGGCATDGAPTVHTRRTRFALARLTDRGRLDPSFSGNGLVRTAIGNARACVADLEIDDDGRIVAAGTSRYATVARYLPGGRLDPSFSGDGRAVPGLYLSPAALALDRAGRILLGGNVGGDLPIAWAVARLRPNGAADPSFGGGAALETPGWNFVSDLAVDRRGRVVAAGSGTHLEGTERRTSFALERYRTGASR